MNDDTICGRLLILIATILKPFIYFAIGLIVFLGFFAFFALAFFGAPYWIAAGALFMLYEGARFVITGKKPYEK